MGLTEYRKKRDFLKTKEPTTGKPSENGPIFVVQEHHASHLHYDFRLEAFGTLKSWAIPKGPPTNPGEKRLAIEVEDHPLDYANFKGRIPEGEYGAGIVKIWDKGVWIPPDHIKDSLSKGHLEFELKGKKLKGKWLLVRVKSQSSQKNQWLLIKRHDEKLPKVDISVKKLKNKTRADSWPKDIKPQLATLTKKIPKNDDWIHEIKLDGYRTIAFIKNHQIQLQTRSGLDWTDRYEPIAKELKKLKVMNAILDGEIVALDKNGHSSFSALQSSLKNQDFRNIAYYLFDILYLNKNDLRHQPLEVRKQILKQTLKLFKSKQIIFSNHLRGQGEELFKKACEQGLEGIVSKNRNLPYYEGRNDDWLKIKCANRQEMVIGGYTEPQGQREGFGALLMGVYEKDQLRYVGRVGTGFDPKMLNDLLIRLKKISVKTSPFAIASPSDRGVHWVKPQLVGEVEFKTWTQDRILRQASFQGLREDKKAKDVVFEVAQKNSANKEIEKNNNSSISTFHITHPNRVIFAKDKITKRDVANYYRTVAPWLLKFIIDRPLSFMRCPERAGEGCFYQKHISSSILSEIQEDTVQDQKVTSINSVAGLLQLVQWGVLEIHTWQGRISKPDHPDQIVFDLDPDLKIPWKKVVEAAEHFKNLLERLDLKSYVKTTGGKGLHIHVPIAAKYGWDEVKNFSRTISKQLEADYPTLYTTNISKNKRKGKIFLDYLRNGAGSTAIAPFSLRSKAHAFVAVPLKWSELKTLKSPSDFDLQKTLKRLAIQKHDPWKGYFKLHQKIKILELAKKHF